VGAEFLGQAFFEAKQLLDEEKHTWELDLTDHQVGEWRGGHLGGARLQRCLVAAAAAAGAAEAVVIAAAAAAAACNASSHAAAAGHPSWL